MRNRAIAALGDAVIPQIPQAIGHAMKTQFAAASHIGDVTKNPDD